MMNAVGVVVWTAKAWLPEALVAFKAAGLRTWGWRRPAVSNVVSSTHYGAEQECSYVVEKLISRGLSGYILDAEGRDAKAEACKADNWNARGAVGAARLFADKIKVAGKASNPEFVYGVTASCREPVRNPQMPFGELIQSADAIYPQCYWGPASVVGRGRRTPVEAFQTAKTDWAAVLPQGKPFFPIAGTLAQVSPVELQQYGQMLRAAAIKEAHFWYYEPGVMPDVKYEAIRSI
jgi:hypothetical protein